MSTARSVRLALALLPLLAGCVDVPELGDSVRPELERAPYPRLIPLDGSYAPQGDPAEDAEKIADGLSYRASQLQRKADALRATPTGDEDES